MFYTDLLFFFFQAEDGIRDVAVTGVQTCALPIYQHRCDPHATAGAVDRAAVGMAVGVHRDGLPRLPLARAVARAVPESRDAPARDAGRAGAHPERSGRGGGLHRPVDPASRREADLGLRRRQAPGGPDLVVLP